MIGTLPNYINLIKPEFYYTVDGVTYDSADGSVEGIMEIENGVARFLVSGEFQAKFKQLIDVFLVGAGGMYSGVGQSAMAGGGGGYTKTVRKIWTAGENEPIKIGDMYNRRTDAFSNEAAGGENASTNRTGGDGGSGGGVCVGSQEGSVAKTGFGGRDGGDGHKAGGPSGSGTPGTGQGTTTKEFGDPEGREYSYGGDTGFDYSFRNAPRGSGGSVEYTTHQTPISPGGIHTRLPEPGIVCIRIHKGGGQT